MEIIEPRRLYQQLAAELKTRIEQGVYLVGDKLPAERFIADEKNVSRTVVREAIIMLEVEGYVGDFGKTTGETFFDLVQALDQIEGIERYRISSIEPNLLTDEIIEFVSHSRSFMPHFHIPLQSGCNEVLKLMRRR